MWSENPLDIFRLATLVMSDPVPAEVDSVYLYGHTSDNEVSILETGLALYKSGISGRLGICGGGPYVPPNGPPDAKVAYSGCAVWADWLVERGARREDIYTIPRPPFSHTGTEAYRLVNLAKTREWRAVCVVANPMHMLRAFANTVACVIREYPELLVYTKPGTPFPWNKEVLSSQGNIFGSRLETGMENEWARLNKTWGNEYDVASAAEVLEYVRWREAQTA